jgi:hypothetical protein
MDAVPNLIVNLWLKYHQVWLVSEVNIILQLTKGGSRDSLTTMVCLDADLTTPSHVEQV